MLQINNLSLGFGGHELLDDVSFTIHSGKKPKKEKKSNKKKTETAEAEYDKKFKALHAKIAAVEKKIDEENVGYEELETLVTELDVLEKTRPSIL
ncbi:hypothetical protein HZC34_05585 [Candidatus Saganbacteria bacterium]|nr:hypothetical protein [Candidatus Saganbacteria bacterium]